MSDIVERLRALETCETELAHDGDCPPEATANWKYAETCRIAAARIEQLEAALRPFAGYTNSEEYIKSGPDDGWCAAISYRVKHYREARAALAAPSHASGVDSGAMEERT